VARPSKNASSGVATEDKTGVTYKHFYPGVQEEIGGGGGKWGRTWGRQRIAGLAAGEKSRVRPGNALPAPSRGCAAPGCACGRAHLHRRGAWPASVAWPQIGHYAREPAPALGGARGSKGSFALQRSLSRWRRMRSTTRGSVIKETMRMRAPQAQSRGSTSFACIWEKIGRE
jgi:hypothetical protein